MADYVERQGDEDIRVLILSVNPAEAENLECELRRAGLVFASRLAETKEECIHSLQEFRPDIILSDDNLLSFPGTEALQVRNRLCPDTPFIFLTAADDEDRANAMLTSGVTDHVLKKNLTRLLSVLTRALSYKKLEEALKASEKRYFDLVKYAPAAVYEIDYKTRRFLTVNDYMCEMSGYSREELLKMDVAELMDDDSRRTFQERVMKVLSGERPDESVEYKIRGKGGREFRGLLKVRFLAEDQTTASVVAYDLTDRMRMEEALRESEERYRLIFETSLNGILFTRPNGSVMSANPSAQKILGMSEREIIEAGRDGIVDLSDPRLGEALEERARTGKYFGELKIRRKDGTAFIAEGSSVIFKDKKGEEYSSIVFQDVSWRKEAEQELKDRTKKLEQANREMESFSYSVSHDLRAPLRAIDGFSAMLLKSLDEKFDDEERRRFDLIRDNTRKMDHLIEDLLALSRISRAEITRKRIDMNRLAEAVWRQEADKNPERSVHFKKSDLPAALGDESLLWQVLSNLFSNAVKYTRKRKKAVVEIGGERGGNENFYFVRDNGAGFDMKYYDKLFGVFQRLHSESEYEGTGVGLAIVQRIIHRLGGRVRAEGKPGRGATFYFSLPAGE